MTELSILTTSVAASAATSTATSGDGHDSCTGLPDRPTSHCDCSEDIEVLITWQIMFSTTQQTVGPVPPGRYTIRATTADGRSAKRSRSVNGEPRARVRLKLD